MPRSAWLAGLLVFIAYVFTAGPTFYWLDSSEFVAAAWSLGVAHPPGHPLASLLGRLSCMLPVGTISFRVTLASALAAALAAVMVGGICHEVLRRLGRPREAPSWIRPGVGLIAALSVGLSYSLWFQAVRAEVYALNLVLLTGAVYLVLGWDRTGDRRRLLGAALVGGLALCNHHLLVLLAVPPLALYALLRRPRPGARRLALGFALAATLGLSTLAYLPLRASQSPTVNWGSATTLERFYWTVSAQAFHQALGRAAQVSATERLTGAGFALLGGLGPACAVLALGGFYLLWRRRETRRAALLLSGLVLFNLISPMLVGFDPLNPDAHGYLAVAVAFLAPGLAVLLAVLAEAASRPQARRLGPAAICLLAGALPLSQGMLHYRECDLHQHWAAEETARELLSRRPGALLLTSYFESIFNAWALQVSADLRPDVSVLHRHFLLQPGYVEDLDRQLPELASLARRWRSARSVLVSDLDRLAHDRPIALEYDLDLAPELVARLRPEGLAFSYIPMGAEGDRAGPAVLAAHARSIRRWAEAVDGGPPENETRRALSWAHYLLAHFACRQHLEAMARLHVAEVRSLAPLDRKVEELRALCRGVSRPSQTRR